jgi:hypothetical protein
VEAVESSIEAEVIDEPGAYTSTHFPQLLKLDLLSEMDVAPTVKAEAVEAGDVSKQASDALFPAATTMTTPFATAFATDVSNDFTYLLVKLKLTTQGDPPVAALVH